MKANQKFMEADDAVSPVIGVILMVAITVVLAAVVFVLVSDLGGGGESTPNMSFQKDESQDTLRVITAGGADWNNIRVNLPTNCHVQLNGGTVIAASGNVETGTTTVDVNAGDVLTFTRLTGQAPGSCAVSLTWVPSQTLLGSWDYEVTGETAAP